MNKNLFIVMIIGSFLSMLYDIFITNRLSEREAQKANYNCEECENWKCYYYYCQRKREELCNNVKRK